MLDWPTLIAALLGGAMGSAHCTAMCGGIAVALAAPVHRDQALAASLRLNFGRVLGYALAGLIAGSVGGGIVAWFGSREVQIVLRASIGLVLLITALRLVAPKTPGLGLTLASHALWRHLAPLHRRLVPALTPLRQWLVGALWGWLPCGLSATYLIIAWLSVHPVHAAALMSAFGFGTLIAMVPVTWSGSRIDVASRHPVARYTAASLIATAAVITFAAPWLTQLPWAHDWLRALGCVVVEGS